MIGIIITAPIELSPFLKKYTDILDSKNKPYEIIQWKRIYEKNEEQNGCFTYYEETQRYGKLTSKVFPFLNFRKFAKK